MRLREKRCARCQAPAPVLFRVRYDDSEAWVFVCETCLPALKENNPHYSYGGTWKASKSKR